MMTRRFALLSVALLVSGCVTVAPHTLSVGDLQRYRLAEVVVEGAGVIRSWPAEEANYLASIPLNADLVDRLRGEPANTFPEVTAHFQRVLGERFRVELTSQAGPVLTGSQPARAVVRLKVFDVPSTARRVFVDQDTKIQADIDLVDARTGATILRYEGPLRLRRLIGGLLAPVAVGIDPSDTGHPMVTEYVSAYRNWLLQN
ncbi:MAG TPA: hypothetical protein VHL98_19730 [Microvirga sp.]|jgi:hypothetical protein|nr:hypothetical protein [Microvirga sp.]